MNPISLVIKVIDQASAQLKAIAQQAQAVQSSTESAGKKGSDALMNMFRTGKDLFGQLTQLAFGFNQILGALETLGQGSGKVFDLLIGQNERLNQSILQAQSSLVSTSRIFKDGIQIKDTTEAIQALAPKMREALDTIAKDSLDLVGVTSSQLTEVFNILLQNSGQLASQSKKGLADSIGAATKLTSDFAAAVGVIMGGNLGQARQEINSILQGTIDMNSTIAKSLGITNEMVQTWKAQGVLVDKLREKLEPYLAGNALAAKSIGGITSNIQELIEIVTRKAGVPLFEAWVETLDKVYKYLSRNQEAIEQGVKQAVAAVLDAASDAMDALGPAVGDLLKALESMGPVVVRVFTLIVQGAATAIRILSPIINIITAIIAKAAEGYEALSRLVFMRQINDADNAIAAVAEQTDNLSDSALNLAQKYKQLNDIRKQGKPLSEDQLKQEKQLQSSARINAEAIDSQIANLKSMTTFSEEQKNAVDAQIAQLERMKSMLTSVGATKGVEVLAKQIPEVGTAFEQMAKQAQGAMEALSKAEGDPTQYAAKAKELMEVTKQQLQLGQITAQEAQKRYQSIATNTKLEASLQTSAQDALVELYKTAGDKRVKVLEEEQSRTQTAMKAGRLSQAAGEQQLTQIKEEQLKIQLDAVRRQIEAEDKLRKQQIQKQINSVTEQITLAQKAIADKESKGETVSGAERKILTDLQTQKQGLEAQMQLKSEKGQQLEAQEKQIQDQLTVTQSEAEKQRLQERLKDYQEQASVNKAALEQKLISEEQYAQLSIENSRKETKEKLKQIADRRAKLSKEDKEGLDALLVEEQQVKTEQFKKEEEFLKNRLQARLNHYDNINKIEESKLNQGLITQEDFAKKSLGLARNRAAEELKQIEDERKRLPKGSAEALEKLSAREAEIRGNLAKQERELLKQQSQARLEHFDRLSALEKAKLDSQLITQEDYAKKSLAIARKRAQEELQQIAAERSKLPAGAADQLEKLAVREAEIKANLLKQERELLQQQYQARLEHFDRLTTLEQSKLDQGLISQQEFAQKSLAIARQRGQEELRQIQEERSKLPAGATEALEKLAAREAEVRGRIAKQEKELQEQIRQARLKEYENRQTELEASFTKQEITEQEFNARSLELGQARIDEEISQAKQRAAQLPETAKAEREAITTQIAKLEADRYKLVKDYEAKIREEILKGFQFRQTELDSLRDRSLISESDYNRKSLELTKGRIAEELKQNQALLNQLPEGDQRRQQLLAKQAQLLGEQAKAEKQYRDQVNQQRLEDFDEQRSLLEASFTERTISEKEYNARSLELTKGRIAEEMQQLDERAARLVAGDKEGLEKIKAERAKLRQQSAQAQKEFDAKERDRIITELEKQQRRATELIAQSEKDRELEIEKLIAAGLMTREKAQEEQLKFARDRITQELELERQKLTQLQALPPSSDPREEENRQSQIRQSRSRTTQLTIDLLKNEQEQRQAAVAAFKREIDQRLEALNNQTTLTTQSWEREIKLIDQASKELGNYTKLMEARNGLQDSLNSMVQSELGVLEQLTTDEKAKADIKELAARLEYEALLKKQEIERQNTELSIEQTNQARERAKMENEIAKAKQKAQIASAAAEMLGVQADTSLDPRTKALKMQAAQARLSAEVEAGQALAQVDLNLAKQQALDIQLAQIQRNKQRAEQSAALVQGQASYIGAIADENARKALQQQLQGDILGQLGIGGIGAIAGINAANRGVGRYARSPYQDIGLRLDANSAFEANPDIAQASQQRAMQNLMSYGTDMQKFLQSQGLGVQLNTPSVKPLLPGNVINLPSSQQTKIPGATQAGAVADPKLISVMDEIKSLVGKISAPVVNQKFEQINNISKGDAEGAGIAKQFDKQVRQGIDKFIVELKRAKV